MVRLALYTAGGLAAAGPADPAVVQGDAIEYHLLARSLAEDGRFRFDAADPVGRPRRIRWEPEPLRTPGYPAFVAFFYALFGPRPGVPIGVQLLLEAATCLLLATVLRRALGVRGAGIVALAYALHPGAALFANLLYSEALFTFLTVAAFAVLVGALDPASRRGLVRMAGAGLLLGLAALVRPVLQPLPVVLAVFLLIAFRPDRRRALVGALVLGAAFAAPLVPWAMRNAARHGHAALSTSGAYNLVALYAASAGDVPPDTLLARAEAAARRDGVAVRTDFDRAPYWRAEAGRVIRAHPAAFVAAQAAGSARLFVSTGRFYRPFVFGGDEAIPPGRRPAALVRWWWHQPVHDRVLDGWWLLYVLAAYPLLAVGGGAAWGRGRPGRRTLALAATLALFLVVVTGTPGHSRFMAPIVPFWAPFVAVGAQRLRLI